jgi:hypothetical protein
MQAAKNILCVVIAIAVGMAVMPRYSFENINQDRILDLQDGILVAQEISNVADTLTHMRLSLAKTITVFKAIADIDEVIKPKNDVYSSNPQITFLLTPCYFKSFPLFSLIDSEKNKEFMKISILPEVPPPRLL